MDDKGKLIISTKSAAAGRKTVVTICGGFLLALGLLGLLMGGELSQAFGRGSTGKIIYYGLCLILIGYGASSLITCFLGGRSYCEVYERAVVGMTCLSTRDRNAPMQRIDLPFSDIVNVTEAGKTIILYTNHGAFDLLALKNREQAIQEIRKRMTGKKDGV